LILLSLRCFNTLQRVYLWHRAFPLVNKIHQAVAVIQFHFKFPEHFKSQKTGDLLPVWLLTPERSKVMRLWFDCRKCPKLNVTFAEL